MLIWRHFAQECELEWQRLPVIFKEVRLHRGTILSKSGENYLKLSMDKATGRFEISQGGTLVATGSIEAGVSGETMRSTYMLEDERYKLKETDLILSSKDFYRDLRVRGYDYGPTFQNASWVEASARRGAIKYTGEWISFVDTMLQGYILDNQSRSVIVPVRLDEV